MKINFLYSIFNNILRVRTESMFKPLINFISLKGKKMLDMESSPKAISASRGIMTIKSDNIVPSAIRENEVQTVAEPNFIKQIIAKKPVGEYVELPNDNQLFVCNENDIENLFAPNGRKDDGGSSKIPVYIVPKKHNRNYYRILDSIGNVEYIEVNVEDKESVKTRFKKLSSTIPFKNIVPSSDIDDYLILYYDKKPIEDNKDYFGIYMVNDIMWNYKTSAYGVDTGIVYPGIGFTLGSVFATEVNEYNEFKGFNYKEYFVYSNEGAYISENLNGEKDANFTKVKTKADFDLFKLAIDTRFKITGKDDSMMREKFYVSQNQYYDMKDGKIKNKTNDDYDISNIYFTIRTADEIYDY